MQLDIEKAIEKGLFSAPDSVVVKRVADTIVVQFDSHKAANLREKVGQFLRFRADKTVVRYDLTIFKNRLGKFEFCWKNNQRPENSEIFVQKLSCFSS